MAAAIRLFARYGYKKTTIDDIAGEMNMTKGNIYRYFINKEDLYHQAVSSVLDGWLQYVRLEAEKAPSPREKFRLVAETAIRYPENNTDFCSLVLQDPEIFAISRGQDNYRPVNSTAEQLLRSILEQGVAEGVFRELNLEYTTQLLFSVYMMCLIKIYGAGEGERGIEMYISSIDLMMNGLLKR